MNKKVRMIGAAVLAAGLCAACGQKTATATAAGTSAPVETTAGAGSTAAGTKAGAAGQETMPSAGEPMIGMPNPMEEYDDIAQLQEALGFMMIDLPQDSGVKNQSYASIDKKVGQIMQESADGCAMTIRMERGSEDISGYYGVEFEERDVNGVTVRAGISESGRVAWWTDDAFSYSFSLEGKSEEDFDAFLAELVSASQ